MMRRRQEEAAGVQQQEEEEEESVGWCSDDTMTGRRQEEAAGVVQQQEEEEEEEKKKYDHFVMVHGIGGGGWCWYKVRCMLEKSGCRVSCVDLKSSGIDPSRPDCVLSFSDYNQPLLHFISALPQHQQVILVGHSAGGLSVTEATYKFPHKIRLAVYVGATMLRSGLSTPQDLTDGAPDLSEHGDVYELGYGLGADRPPTSAIVKKEFHRKLIYGMSPQEDLTLAGMLLRPGPVLAIRSARFRTSKEEEEEEEKEEEEEAEVDTVPRVYIKTSNDMVLKPEQQDAMIRRWPPSRVYVLESDHSPFFSSPNHLSRILLQAAAAAAAASLS
ncbi:methylesterase 17 [Malania oleifera]|uniref:methylesterase 17 n=1 Tax=Malania oleifera TaxID=397392 RepID=UPI0025AE9827|nr:methylesterase 17 [Malania oleifera]